MYFKDIISAWFHQWRWPIVAFVTFILALNFYLGHTILLLTITTPTGVSNVRLTASNKEGDERSVFALGTLAVVNRDTALISASSGNLLTYQDISPLPWFEFKEVALTLDRDKNVEKVSGNNFGCSVYNKKTQKLSTFSCGNPFGLFTYKTSTTDGVSWENKPSLNFPQSYNATAYHDGVMGIANNVSPWLFYADANTNKVSQVRLPVPGMSRSEISSISVVSDSANPTQANFLLVDHSTGIIWFGIQNGTDITYRKYEHKISDSSTRFASSNCTLVNTTAYCYFGNTSASPDSEGETIRYENSGDGVVDVIDFSSTNSTVKKFTVPKELPIDRIYADKNGQMYGYTDSVLYTLKPNNNSFDRVVLASDVGSVSGGDALYYVKDNRLYIYDSSSKTTSMLFESRNLRLSSINLFGDTVFINAYIKNAPGNTLHTYKLLDEANTTPGKRLVDILPIYPAANQPNIIAMDYTKNTIHVVLPNYVEYKSGKIVPSNSVYNSQKTVIRSFLSNIVPSFNTYKLTFSRSDKF